MVNKPILLIVASEGFHPVEYGETKKILQEAGFTVKTASNSTAPAIAKDGSTTEVDLALRKVSVNDYAGIFFIGGPGAIENLDNETSHHIARDAMAKNVPVGAICISPLILVAAGVLQGKKATGWNEHGELEKAFKDHGVQYVPDKVVVDGTIVTASGPQAAQQFAEEIIGILQSSKTWG
jgi:protease I